MIIEDFLEEGFGASWRTYLQLSVVASNSRDPYSMVYCLEEAVKLRIPELTEPNIQEERAGLAFYKLSKSFEGAGPEFKKAAELSLVLSSEHYKKSGIIPN